MQSCQHPSRSIKKQKRAIAIIGYHVDISIATADVYLSRHHVEAEDSLARNQETRELLQSIRNHHIVVA